MTRNQRTQESKYCFSHLRLNGEGPHINLGSVHTHSYDLTVSVAWVGSTLPLLRSHQAQLDYRLIWESELPGLALGSSLQLRIWGSCFHPGSSSRPHSAPAQGCLSRVAFSRAGQLEFKVIRGTSDSAQRESEFTRSTQGGRCVIVVPGTTQSRDG